MKKKISIVSIACAPHAVSSFHLTIKKLKEMGYPVSHVGLSTGAWVPSQYHDTVQAYESYGYPAFNIPRVDKTSIGSNPNYKKEFTESFFQINKFVKSINKKYHPDFVLIDNERNVTTLITKIFKNINPRLPILLLNCHGFISDYRKIYHNLFRKKLIEVYRFIRDLPGIFIKKIKSTNELESFLNHPRVKLIGENDSDYICCCNEEDYKIFRKFKVLKKIIKTGNPYFDQIVGIKKYKPVKRKREKILIVVSHFTHGDKNRIINLYDYISYFYTSLSHQYDIFLRLKPRVPIPGYLPNKSRQVIKKINLDDNSLPSYFSVSKYDLIVGDPSTVLLEAIILGKPVAIFNHSFVSIEPGSYARRVMVGKLGVKLITDNSELKTEIDSCLKPVYAEQLRKKLKTNEKELFVSLDGKSASRVAKIILKILRLKIFPQ